MADTILTLKQTEDFFQSLTLQMLGLDPAASVNQSRVRVGWPAKGAPAWKIDEDVAFLLVNYDSDPITQQMDISYENADSFNANRTMSYTNVIRLNWVCYGSNSFNDMDKIRSSLYLPDFTLLMAEKNIALILDVPMPVRSPELFNGQWWDRTSFYARFNEKVTKHASVPYFQSANVQTVKG